MRGVSFATSDTEDNKSTFEANHKIQSQRKKRLSRVEEEIKVVNNQIRETKSEYNVLNKSNVTSQKDNKSVKNAKNKEKM